MCSCFAVRAAESAGSQEMQPVLKKATIGRVAPLIQLAQLYAAKGPLEDRAKAKKLYEQIAAYRRQVQQR
jgi:hypothetical protein